jgi:lysophospholipase L1-like esterase
MATPVLARLRFAAVVALVSIVALEGVLVLLRHLPAMSAVRPLAPLARELYMLDRHMIQFEDDAARWDARLGYTLRPGRFRFSNTEFDTEYQINPLGIRDDGASLEGPRIVVIGDSFAMGWGVEQEESFPQVLERLSNRVVLNASVASYGTARQLRLLEDVDLEHTSHLVIQFCNNDYFENLAFEREGPAFGTQDRDGYDGAVRTYRSMRRYFPGRYTLTLVGRRLGSAPEEPDHPDPKDPANQRRQAELLLNVLTRSRVDLSHLQIVVFELNGHNRDGQLFIPALAKVIAGHQWPDFIERMIVDLAAELKPELFYQLDDHLTAEGHEYLANRLWEIIRPTLDESQGL